MRIVEVKFPDAVYISRITPQQKAGGDRMNHRDLDFIARIGFSNADVTCICVHTNPDPMRRPGGSFGRFPVDGIDARDFHSRRCQSRATIKASKKQG